MGNFKRKNYYMIETLKKEIDNYDTVSFALFDTLLLSHTFDQQDFFLMLDNFVEKQTGVSGFHYLREEAESNWKKENPQLECPLAEIYKRIEEKIQNPDGCGFILEMELKLIKENLFLNPLLEPVFMLAKEKGKTLFIIEDTNLPKEFIVQLLDAWEIQCPIYTSFDCGYTKISGQIYDFIIAKNSVKPERWLHLGSNYPSDIEAAKQKGILTYYFQPIRERFRAVEKEKAELEQPYGKLVDTVSLEQMKEINSEFLKIEEPSDDVAVKVENVSMMFNMSSEKLDNLKEYIIKLLQGKLMFQEFWALRDISFEVKRGEKIGLIGLNGSGKSTMLKIISGVLKPTEGKVEVQGTIAPLIELGAGFDHNLSARENVYLNGAILGYNRSDMAERYRQIIEFAELEEFQDVPIKNYSSGMIARLGFAIATSHIPDILIIDEILSVGDFEFQKKCHQKMRELTDKGATVLFVSHSAEDIIHMCDQVLWLNRGTLVDYGEAEYLVNKYLRG